MNRIKRTKRRLEEDGVDLAAMTVDILKAAAAAVTSVPALGAAAGIVSSILQQISQAQENTELALRIAARCARVSVTISKHLETLVITSVVLDHIKSFEENLHDIRDFIERETSRNIFYLTIFAKRRAGQLQELQSRVQETMSLFQITTLITLHDIAQRFATSHLRINSGVSSQDRLERTLNEPDDRTIGELDVIPEVELLVRDEFRLHLARVDGKYAVLKVFEGEDAQENCKKTANIEKHVMHPNLLCLKQCYASRISPFIVYGQDFQATAENVIAEQVIAASIPQGVIPTFIVGAQLISGVAAAISYLLRHSVPNLHTVGKFSVLMNSARNVVLSVDDFSGSTSVVSRPDRTGLDILSDLCYQTFNAAHEILYRDTKARTSDTLEPSNASIVDAENEDQMNMASDKPDTVTTIDANLSRSRREITWQGFGGNNMTLDDISYQFKAAVLSLSFTLLLEHVSRTTRGHRTVHRCPGYRREEVTLRPVLSDCKVITHATPSLHEKCLICGKDVEEGQFNCQCGEPDDGISPTVKCTMCSVWGHRHCNDQSAYCWRCVYNLAANNGIRPQLPPDVQSRIMALRNMISNDEHALRLLHNNRAGMPDTIFMDQFKTQQGDIARAKEMLARVLQIAQNNMQQIAPANGGHDPSQPWLVPASQRSSFGNGQPSYQPPQPNHQPSPSQHHPQLAPPSHSMSQIIPPSHSVSTSQQPPSQTPMGDGQFTFGMNNAAGGGQSVANPVKALNGTQILSSGPGRTWKEDTIARAKRDL